METYGYIYLTTNKINDKRYIGQHKSKDWDYKYFGSGKLLNRAIQKYGIENFTCFPLAWAWNKNELNRLEIEYIAHYKPEYNLTKGRDGGATHFNSHSEATKQKISESQKGNKYNLGKKFSEEHRRKISEKNKNNTAFLGHKHTDMTKQKMSEAHKNLSNEARKKMSESHKGKHYFTNGIINILDYKCPTGFINGRTKLKVA